MQLVLVKNGLTKFQNCSFGKITFPVLLLRCFILNFLQIELHLFFIFFIFTKFSLGGYFRYLSIHDNFSEFFCHKWRIITSHFLLFYRSMFISNWFEKIKTTCHYYKTYLYSFLNFG